MSNTIDFEELAGFWRAASISYFHRNFNNPPNSPCKPSEFPSRFVGLSLSETEFERLKENHDYSLLRLRLGLRSKIPSQDQLNFAPFIDLKKDSPNPEPFLFDLCRSLSDSGCDNPVGQIVGCDFLKYGSCDWLTTRESDLYCLFHAVINDESQIIREYVIGPTVNAQIHKAFKAAMEDVYREDFIDLILFPISCKNKDKTKYPFNFTIVLELKFRTVEARQRVEDAVKGQTQVENKEIASVAKDGKSLLFQYILPCPSTCPED